MRERAPASTCTPKAKPQVHEAVIFNLVSLPGRSEIKPRTVDLPVVDGAYPTVIATPTSYVKVGHEEISRSASEDKSISATMG